MVLFGFGYKKKLEEIKQHLEMEEYEEAALIADDIPIQKLKTAYETNLVGKAYKFNGDFLQARNAFLRSYELRPSRTVILDIMDCCLEAQDVEGAEKYFNEYHKAVPEDKVTQYMYRYRIEKKKGRERRLLITILEELKALEYREEFAYELAKQYHKAGMVQECMNECNDIILWFGNGPTVERAKTLLAYYRGEISLEEIKSAGARHQTEMTRRCQEEGREPAPETVEETQVQAEEVRFAEPQTEEPQPQELAQEEETDDFELPEIDLSGISFDDAAVLEEAEAPVQVRARNTEGQENTCADEELYVPEEITIEISNDKLAEAIKNRKVAIGDILKNFSRIERIRKQIVKSLELILGDREKNYFVITGDAQTGKTTLAFAIIRLLFELDIVKDDRTATIDSVQLNQVSIEDYGEELKNCNLIIENAGGMTKESVDGLLRFYMGNNRRTCLILEDSVRDINKFLRGRDELSRLFNNRIHLGKYNTDDLLGFAYDRIKKEDCCIDKTAAQVLKNKIDEIVREYGNEERLMRTLELTELILERADKRTGKSLPSMTSEEKILQEDYPVIIPEDVT